MEEPLRSEWCIEAKDIKRSALEFFEDTGVKARIVLYSEGLKQMRQGKSWFLRWFRNRRKSADCLASGDDAAWPRLTVSS
jgi:hypothetical protein